MIKKEINLKPMNSIGSCRAAIEDNRVRISAHGIAGCMKAWLTGDGDAEEIGNLVNGAIDKKISTEGYNGVLITQSGRQIFYGRFAESEPVEISDEKSEEKRGKSEEEEAEEESENEESGDEERPRPAEPAIFSFGDGFSWREVTSLKYPSESPCVRYILSHRSFYRAYCLHGRYYYGEKGGKIAVAIECDLKNEPHPLPLLSAYCVLRDGYMIISSDTDSKNFHIYEY